MAQAKPVRLSRVGHTITADARHYMRLQKTAKSLGMEFWNDGGGFTFVKCTRDDLKVLCDLTMEEQTAFESSEAGQRLLKKVA